MVQGLSEFTAAVLAANITKHRGLHCWQTINPGSTVRLERLFVSSILSFVGQGDNGILLGEDSKRFSRFEKTRILTQLKTIYEVDITVG
jgi:hypothetical protein